MRRAGAPAGPAGPNARLATARCTCSMRDTIPAKAWPPSLLAARSSAGVIGHLRRAGENLDPLAIVQHRGAKDEGEPVSTAKGRESQPPWVAVRGPGE
ncbi:MAG TPA: hypothetical protein VMV92_22480 [Streptosporangiaceae bacterium]|nr:hypothetical protein [Streptosporangiaceae bacterium]